MSRVEAVPSVMLAKREDEILMKLAVMDNQMGQVRKELQSLNKILVEDGQNSITIRLSVLETKQLRSEKQEEDRQSEKITIRAALISSILGLITSLGVAIIEIFWKR